MHTACTLFISTSTPCKGNKSRFPTTDMFNVTLPSDNLFCEIKHVKLLTDDKR